MIDQNLSLVSEELRSKARVLSSGEAFWPKSCIVRVLRELAQKDRVIHGFDIVILEPTANGWAPCIIGESTYDMGLEISAGSWNESIAHSLQLALRDLERAAETDGSPNADDGMWYAIVTSDRESENELRRAYSQNKDGSFELRFPRGTKQRS